MYKTLGLRHLLFFNFGLKRLLQSGIADFNIWISYISGLLYNPYEDGFDKATDNMLKDFQMLRLIICFYLNILIEFFLLILTLVSI